MNARRVLTFLAILACGVTVVHVERASERPLPLQPGPDAIEYASTAQSLAHDSGYYGSPTAAHSFHQPPRYPPGYAMALAPFAAIGSYPRNVQRGAKFWAMMYVLVAVAAAWVLGGPLAAIIVAILIGVSPYATETAGFVLSDAFTATLAVAMLLLLRHMNRSGARLAGAVGGFSLLARVTGGLSLIALLASLERRYIRTALLMAVPSLVIIALIQWALYGSPLETGYAYWGVTNHNFSLSFLTGTTTREAGFIYPDLIHGQLLNWVCPCQLGGPEASFPNIAFYPLVLIGMFWMYSPPFIPLLGLLYAWRHRRDAIGRYALLMTALTLALFDVYFYQAARFMAGPATILTVLAGVWLAEVAGKIWGSRRNWSTEPAA